MKRKTAIRKYLNIALNGPQEEWGRNSSVVNITVTKGEDVSFRIKLGSISYGKVLQHWDKVPGEVGNASSLSVLKRQCP